MNNYIFDVVGRKDNLCQEIIDLSAHSSDGRKLTPIQKGDLQVTRFASDEYSASFMHSIRGDRVFLLCSTLGTASIAMLESAIDAARRNSAAEIIAIVPYFAYARQDRKDARPGYQRSSIGASMQAIKYEALGLTRIIIADVHSEQAQGMFRIPVDHAECSELIAQSILERYKDVTKLTLASPDAGGVKRVTKVMDYLMRIKPATMSVQIAFCSKERDENNKIKAINLYGEVDGCVVVYIDDMFDTAGTIVEAAAVADMHGATAVDIIGTHGIFTEPAPQRLGASVIRNVVVTDSIEPFNTGDEFGLEDKIDYLSIAPVLARYVRASINGHSSIEK